MNIPNNYQETLAQQVRWAARNLAYNLDFLPPDKLDWKPAPAAPSALEIINHIIGAVEISSRVLRGASWNEASAPESPAISVLEEAKAKLIQTADDFASALEAVRPDQMDRLIETPFGRLPLGEFMRFEPVDIVHHHGQIAYIQQLFGDTESHFDPDIS